MVAYSSGSFLPSWTRLSAMSVSFHVSCHRQIMFCLPDKRSQGRKGRFPGRLAGTPALSRPTCHRIELSSCRTVLVKVKVHIEVVLSSLNLGSPCSSLLCSEFPVGHRYVAFSLCCMGW